MSSMLDRVWDDVVGGAEWLKAVVFGEFEDNRPTSAVIADMLVSFIPGFIIATSARDLTAVILRLWKHPEKREHIEEWMIVIACVIPLALEAILMAAGALVSGVGAAVVGGLAGSEAGAALRAVVLMLIEESGKMLEPLVQFLRKFLKGDIMKVLRDIKFAQYGEAIAKRFSGFIEALDMIVKRLLVALRRMTWFSGIEEAIAKLEEMEKGFYAVQRAGLQKIPLALGILQERLAKALAEPMKALDHPIKPNLPAPHPAHVPVKPKRVAAMSENPLGHPPDVEKPGNMPEQVAPDHNLHPQTTKDPTPGEGGGSDITSARPSVPTPADMEQIGTVDQVRSAESVNTDMQAANKDPAWAPDTDVTTKTVPVGTRVNMVVNEGQARSLLK